MKKYTVCALHHQVLIPWTALRRQLEVPPRVLTLDYHTDTMPCFRHTLPPPSSGDYQDDFTVQEATEKLRHDEHFDWALHAGVISRADILAYCAPAETPEHPALTVYAPPEFPTPEVMLNQPELFREQAEKVLESSFLEANLAPVLPAKDEKFILDIDCDYIMCARALAPADDRLFHDLIKQAAAVTFSCENDWVRLLKLPGETITGESIAAAIISKYLQ